VTAILAAATAMSRSRRRTPRPSAFWFPDRQKTTLTGRRGLEQDGMQIGVRNPGRKVHLPWGGVLPAQLQPGVELERMLEY
jgi:hypothetical protein